MLAHLAPLLAGRPRRTLLVVLAFLGLAAAFGGSVASSLDSAHGFTPDSSDSTQAIVRAERASGHEPAPGVTILVRTPGGLDAVGARVTQVADELRALLGISAVLAPTVEQSSGLVADDGSSALVVGFLQSSAKPPAVAREVVALGARLDATGDDIVVGGPDVAELQIESTVTSDLTRAELIALPVLVLLSLLFFGGRAALLPVGVGAVTVLGTFVVIRIVNEITPLSVFALNLVVGLGLGLAIDYSLFLVTRYREELDAGGPGMDAVVATMTSAGRTVLYSAATVAVAMASLTVFPMSFLRSMGIAGAIIAPVAALGALIVSPAVFGLWGVALQRRSRVSSERRWRGFALAVMRRPGLIALATGVVMLALSAPALRAQWSPVDTSVVPPGLSARTLADTVERDYPGRATVSVVLQGGPSDAAAVTSYADELAARPGVRLAGAPVALGDSHVTAWLLDLAAPGDPASDAAQSLVRTVREVPSSLDPLVTGPAAEFVDQQEAIRASLPLAAGLLFALTLVALWLLTGSVVLPLKAVVMNLATVGVALGALTVVYQDGRLTGVLNYTPDGGVEPTTFLVAAAIVFALSTDYGVFLLARIKEERAAPDVTEREAVARGLARTGSVVTAAAVLLAVAICVFATSSISLIQQIGMATPVGVLVDAFVVRSLLVPSLMALFGAWNWWSPRWLARLHRRLLSGEVAHVDELDAAMDGLGVV